MTIKLKKIKQAKNMQVPGEMTEIILGLEGQLTASFDQKQEAEADLFGMDIMYPSIYKTCESINLWNRMGNNENVNMIQIFTGTHPFSSSRAKCVKNHMQTNYNKECK